MALVGYARVSTIDQNLDIQLDTLNGAGCKKIFSEKKSGTSKKDRTALDECMEYIREGDTLVVTRIDRLTRSILDLQNLLHYLKEKAIHLKALEQPVDTSNASGKFFLDMLGVFAEFETNLRRERQLEGIERAKREGKYKGRKPTARSKTDDVMELINQGFTRTAIAKKLNMGIASVYRILKTHRQDNPEQTIPGMRISVETITEYGFIRSLSPVGFDHLIRIIRSVKKLTAALSVNLSLSVKFFMCPKVGFFCARSAF